MNTFMNKYIVNKYKVSKYKFWNEKYLNIHKKTTKKFGNKQLK